MLRLNDTDVRPGHRGELRVLVAARRTGLGQVRAYLAADLLRRLAQRSGLAPTVVDLGPHRGDDLRAVCAALNIHPPSHTLTPPVTADQLSGLFARGVREQAFDVGVRSAGEIAGDAGAPGVALARYWVDVAGAADGTSGQTQRPLRELLHGQQEPLSVRMMLLRYGYGEALRDGEAFGDGGALRGGADLDGADLDGADLGGAAKTLARWRELVARWARSPSGPMSRRYADAVAAAVAGDLDTAAALREMDALADDPGEPDGVKFETFAAADLLFGLDLARDVGRLTNARQPGEKRNEATRERMITH